MKYFAGTLQSLLVKSACFEHFVYWQDLKRANENRARVPWVIVIGHRPLYCSSLFCYSRCHDQAPVYRSYLEDLLYQHHVDVVSHYVSSLTTCSECYIPSVIFALI